LASDLEGDHLRKETMEGSTSRSIVVSVKSEEPLHLFHVILFRFVPCRFVLFRFVPCHFVLLHLFLFCLSVFSVERVSDEGGDGDAESHDAHLDEGHQNFNFIRHDVILRS